MRLIMCLYVVMLVVSLTGCRTKKQVSGQATERTMLETSESRHIDDKEQITTILNTTGDMELAGIAIEYFTPDSAGQPETLTKRVTVENVKVHRESESATVKEHTIVLHDTVTVQAEGESRSSLTEQSQHSAGIDWGGASVVGLLLVIAAIFGWLVYDNFKRE